MKAKFKSSTLFACVLTVLALAIPAVSHAQYYMTANDVNGATTSFNGAGTWNNGLAPAAGNTYSTVGYFLRGPNVAGSYTFAGSSLTVGGGSGGASGGSAFLGSSSVVTPNSNGLIFKATGEILTVTNLILDGAQIRDGNGDGNVATLNGNITVTTNGGAFMAQDTNIINSALSGSGPIYIGDNGSGEAVRVIVFTSGSSTFNGNIIFNNTHSSAAFSLLTFAPGSVMNFTIGANGVNNNITGISGSGTSGTLTLNGNFAFNLSGAGHTVGNSWDIVDPSVTTIYGSTFAVAGFTQNGSLWDGIANGIHYRFNTTNGILSVVSFHFLVTNTADSGPGSLRAAVANCLSGDSIAFATNLSGQTILLTNGQIALNQSLTIDASALPGGITINGNQAGSVFSVTGGNVTLNDLTITNGNGINNNLGGGGIYNTANLTLNECTLAGNSSPQFGGGIENNGGTLVLNQCTLTGNSCANPGGAGIDVNAGTVTVNQSTLTGNSTPNSFGAGGIYNNLGSVTINNSIVAGNTAPTDANLYGSVTATGVNLTTGVPLLAPLGNYGGPTQTMPPLPGSPAIDGCTNGTTFTTDQRGFPRVVGPFPDIGAVEYETSPVVTTNLDGGVGSLRYAITYTTNGSDITFAPGLSGQTILLTNGQITLNQSLTIDASALPGGITINGNQAGSVFSVTGGNVTLNDLTITNGNGINNNLGGGGIYNTANLTLNECTLAGNSSPQFGGGIENNGGTLVLNQCTLTGNSCASDGGAGIDVNAGTVTVNQSTLTLNNAPSGSGGIFNFGGSVTIFNSIVAGNTSPNTEGTITQTGVNLTSGNPLLAPLGNYGGPTPTMPPLPGSPAIDGCTNGTTFTTDQRGFPRVVGPFADIGAVESGNPIPCLMVNTAVDKNDGLGTDGASLRDAIAYAPAGSTIIFAPALSGATIVLTNGQLNVPNSVTILGPGSGALTVSGNGASPVFNITGANVTISGLTIANGYSTNNGAGIYAGGGAGSSITINNCIVTNNSTSLGGGGIFNSPGLTMTISNCIISGNQASQNAGGIYNSNATLTVIASTLSGNAANFIAGGIFNYSQSGSATLTLNTSTLSGNTAYSGGGIVNFGESGTATLAINASTLSGNSAYSYGGGGLYNYNATLTLNISTLSGNSANAFGGGIYNESATLTINASTFSGNSALTGGGIINNHGTLNIGDTILNAGASGENIYPGGGTATSYGYNLSSDDGGGFLTATGDQINTDPKLGLLQNNGGPTWTCALLPGSPAIDQGKTNAVPGLACSTDQRGFPRPCDNPYLANATGGDGSDIGAYEVQVDAALLTRPSFNTNGAGWYLNGDTVNGGPNITNNVFTLTDGAGGENRSAWFSYPLYVGGFQASFTYQDIGGVGADGAAFVIQNDPSGTAALGLNGGGLGYVGITPSVAVLLNIFWDSPGGVGLMLGTNGVGAYYASGASSGRSYQSTAPVNLAGGNPIAVALRYTGGILDASFTDTVTSNNFQTSIPVDIPAFVETDAAWVGFTGSEGGTWSHQIVSNFSYRPLPTLIIRQSQPASLVFTWPAAVDGFTLQSNSSLNNPAGWTSVAGTSTQTNGLNQVTIPSPTSTQFYRLVLPGGP